MHRAALVSAFVVLDGVFNFLICDVSSLRCVLTLVGAFRDPSQSFCTIIYNINFANFIISDINCVCDVSSLRSVLISVGADQDLGN